MRVVALVLLLLSTLARADNRVDRARAAREHGEAGSIDDLRANKDIDALGWLALAKSGMTRERALDALVELGALDAKARNIVPTRETIDRELAKGLAAGTPRRRIANGRAKGMLNGEACFIKASSPSSLVLTCAHHGCGGACRVVEAEAEVRVQKSKFSVRDVLVKDLGDTGECGCCMMLE
jgi:hypothetical protein